MNKDNSPIHEGKMKALKAMNISEDEWQRKMIKRDIRIANQVYDLLQENKALRNEIRELKSKG